PWRWNERCSGNAQTATPDRPLPRAAGRSAGGRRIKPASTYGAMCASPKRPTVLGMTTPEYILNFALVGLVLLQIRGITITKAALLFPVVMTVWIATSLLHAIPTAGNDLHLEVGGALAGATLGALAGLATSVTRRGANAMAKAGAPAA